MKPNTDETPDEWVRQKLSRLPDAPPPGSSFDSARLWDQLQPELTRKPTRRRVGWVGWLSAACLIGLMIGGRMWKRADHEPQPVVSRRSSAGAAPSLSSRRNRVETSDVPPVVAGNNRPSHSRSPRPQRVSPPKDVKSLPTLTKSEPVTPTPDRVAATDDVWTKPVVIEKPAESRKTNSVAIAPKRRFRVMHENELRAEDEAAPKLYRTDHFVRLGRDSQRNDEPRTANGLESRPPALILPLTNNSNH